MQGLDAHRIRETQRGRLACRSGGLAAVAGCGDSGGERGKESSSEAGLVDWPLFGRVPERTHYLPARKRALDPPLREAWSINTHALIEFPPAVANGSPTSSTSTATPKRCG